MCLEAAKRAAFWARGVVGGGLRAWPGGIVH